MNYLLTVLSRFIMRLEYIGFRKSQTPEKFHLNTVREYASLGIAAILLMSWGPVYSFGYSANLVGGKNTFSGFVTTTKSTPSTDKTISVVSSTKGDTSKKTVDETATPTDREFATISVDTTLSKQLVMEAIQSPVTGQIKEDLADPLDSSAENPLVTVREEFLGIDYGWPPIQTLADDPGAPIKLAAPDNVIKIKFRDGHHIRLVREDPRDRDSRLIPMDLKGNALTSALARDILKRFEKGTWARTHIPNEKQLDELRAKTMKLLGESVPDLNLYFSLLLPDDIAAKDAIQWFKILDEVESAREMPDYYLANAPDYSEYRGGQIVTIGDVTFELENDYQRYLEPAPVGVDAYYAWQKLGGNGAGVNVVDIESAFDRNHPDLPQITEDGVPFAIGNVESKNINHGSATLGVIVGLDNGDEAVKGIAHMMRPPSLFPN